MYTVHQVSCHSDCFIHNPRTRPIPLSCNASVVSWFTWLNYLQICQKDLKLRLMWLYYSCCVSNGLWRSRVVSVEWRQWDAEVVSSVLELKGFWVLFVCDFILSYLYIYFFFFNAYINPRFLPFVSVWSRFKLTCTCSWTEIIHNMPTHLCRHVHTCIHLYANSHPLLQFVIVRDFNVRVFA